jgi:ribose transport system substrate-binding protein
MSQFVVPLRLAGKTEAVKFATFNGTPFVLDFIRQGSVDMDIGEASMDRVRHGGRSSARRLRNALPT